MENLTLLLEVVQLTAGLSFQEKQVDVAVIVGQRTLLAVAHRTGEQGNQPDINAPGLSGSLPDMERKRLVHQAQADGRINRNKPKVAGKSVEHTSPAGFLAGHTRQLSVAAVIMVGPYQQEDTNQRMGHVGIIEHYPCRHPEDDGQDGHHIGMDAETLEKQGPHITDGAIEMDVQKLFCIHGLERSLYSFFLRTHYSSNLCMMRL